MSHHNEEDEKAKARLHNLHVDEVSLVDRAANKRRFLLIKRQGADLTGEVMDVAERGLSSLASAALDVQMERDGSVQRFVELLRTTADDISKVAGIVSEDVSEDAGEEKEESKEEDVAEDPVAVQQQAEPTTQEEPVEENPAADVAQEESKEEVKETETSSEVSKELVASMVDEAVAKALEPHNARFDSIAKSLETLTAQNVQFGEVMKTWSDRLDGLEKVGQSLEKSFDPPNSQTVDPVTTGQQGSGNVAWPMDMNSKV
jgi:hypothetical protein